MRSNFSTIIKWMSLETTRLLSVTVVTIEFTIFNKLEQNNVCLIFNGRKFWAN